MTPKAEATARRLAEMMVSMIEGGLILERAYGAPGLTARRCEQFREYLGLLFPTAAVGPAGRAVAADTL